MGQDQFADQGESKNKLLIAVAATIGIIIIILAVFVAISFLKLQNAQRLINQKQAEEIKGTDADNDNLPEGLEAILGTDPNNSDSDGNGVLDGQELPQIPAPTAPAQDSDQDGVPDGLEAVLGTDPNNPDSGIEQLPKPTPPSKPVPAQDTDKDGLPDGLEAVLGTDPNNPDSDGNGITDGEQFKK